MKKNKTGCSDALLESQGRLLEEMMCKQRKEENEGSRDVAVNIPWEWCLSRGLTADAKALRWHNA